MVCVCCESIIGNIYARFQKICYLCWDHFPYSMLKTFILVVIVKNLKYLFIWARLKTRKSRKLRKSRKKQSSNVITNSANKKKERQNTKVKLIKSEKKKLKNKDFPWNPGFLFESYAQKRKLLKSRKFYKTATILKYENHTDLKMIQPYSQSGTTYLSFKSL